MRVTCALAADQEMTKRNSPTPPGYQTTRHFYVFVHPVVIWSKADDIFERFSLMKKMCVLALKFVKRNRFNEKNVLGYGNGLFGASQIPLACTIQTVVSSVLFVPLGANVLKLDTPQGVTCKTRCYKKKRNFIEVSTSVTKIWWVQLTRSYGWW